MECAVLQGLLYPIIHRRLLFGFLLVFGFLLLLMLLFLMLGRFLKPEKLRSTPNFSGNALRTCPVAEYRGTACTRVRVTH